MKPIPEEDKARFTRAVSVQAQDEVFYCEELIDAEQMKDAMDKVIPGLSQAKGEVALFFVDQEPMANWAHPCLYVLVHRDGSITQAQHYLPPAEEIPLSPFSEPGSSFRG
jgi:hypothetical protein